MEELGGGREEDGKLPKEEEKGYQERSNDAQKGRTSNRPA